MFSEFFHLHTVLPVNYMVLRQRKDVIRESEKSDHKIMCPDFCQWHTVLPVIYLMDGGKGRTWSKQERKEIIRIMFPDFCQCHSVLPVIYFTGWRQRKDVKRESKKSYCKDDDSNLLPLSHRSTCYLFYGIEAKKNHEEYVFWLLSLHLPVIYEMDGDRGSTWSEQERK